jgi:hypothetical protein
MKNKEVEKYWDKFLKTGKVEDFLKYRKIADFKETKTDIEIAQVKDNKEVKNAGESSVYRYRCKKS